MLSSSEWSCLEHILFLVTTVMIWCLFVTFTANEYTVCVADWKGVSPTPEIRGLLYMASLNMGIACGEFLPQRVLTSTSLIRRLYSGHDLIGFFRDLVERRIFLILS